MINFKSKITILIIGLFIVCGCGGETTPVTNEYVGTVQKVEYVRTGENFTSTVVHTNQMTIISYRQFSVRMGTEAYIYTNSTGRRYITIGDGYMYPIH